MGFAALQSVVYNEVSGCLGYLIPPRRSSFPSRPRGVPLVAVPHGFRYGFILSCAFRPSRASRVTARPAEPSTSHGLPSLIATSTGGVHSRRRPRACFVPSSTFRTPPTVSSSTDLAGLFHPAATSRVRSSGSSPREKPYGLVARRCPPVVHTGPLPTVLSIGAREQCPPPGLFSTRESVANHGGLDHCPLGTLLSFCLPRVLLPAPRKRPSSPSPTTAFPGPRRVASARPDLLLRACLPRPRFLA